MRKFLVLFFLPLLAAAVFAASPPTPSFRFSRPVQARSGWCVLELPDDVLDACRPGLPDLRLEDVNGAEVPYASEQNIGGAASRLELTNVESIPRRETTALLDRGPRPPLAGNADLEITGDEFLKPVVLEASDDGKAFREIARATVFAHAGQRWTTLRFAKNDRRYWRFRFDDRNGDPIAPLAVRIEGAGVPASSREIPLTLAFSAGDGFSSASAALPAANLGVTAIRLSVEDPAFERRVRVFERVFFRDEISRRLVGEASISRSPGGPANSQIPVCDLAGKNLEVEIENGGSPPLRVSSATALSSARRLLFFAAPGNGKMRLLYGSPTAPAPRYDLPSALRRGPPKSLVPASLDAPVDAGAAIAALAPARGAAVDSAAWRSQRGIETPSGTGVAYLDLPQPIEGGLRSVRILDAENRPVPYVVEQGARHVLLALGTGMSQKGNRTVVQFVGLDPSRRPDAITLFATAPEYFSRDVAVLEEERDARGVIGERILGSAHWERRPGENPRPVTIEIAPGEQPLRAEIENADNAPLTIDRAQAALPLTRIDFAFRDGENLRLVSDNPEAAAPRYDLALIAGRVLASPAGPARLKLAQKPAAKPSLPGWFWIAVVLAAVLVAGALVRTLQAEAPRV